jgi:acyl-coenzyme A synthetase/AMP-(fatty) acid ligase/3-hydroxymyristoyl/3-hydroxydecanoyl-(acyl carrier protein) dehydratase
MISLCDILTHGYPPEQPVCLGPARTWADLRQVSHEIQDRLPPDATKPLLLAVDSTFQFVASLLACWQSRVPVMISPDTQPRTLAQLLPLTDGCITDRLVNVHGVPVVRVAHKDVVRRGETTSDLSHPRHTIVRRKDELALELFTSGSGGERKRVPKTFAQLDNELLALKRQWGKKCQSQVHLATVSHLHIYGLLFKVLWPLCRGDAFHDRSFFFWEEMLGQILHCPATIISSPAHLRHLPQAARQIRRDWSQTCIFSSGGPLQLEIASDVMSACGQAPIEVYGSTETGGIACRQQRSGCSTPWQPLPEVSCKIEGGLLSVQSDRLPNPQDWFLTCDRADPEGETGFHLLGRSDRIIKILEKRVSLDQMEAALREHPAVHEACAILLPIEKASDREMLGIAIELAEAGRMSLAKNGKIALAAELKRHLQLSFETVTLPRRWRFIDKLPGDPQGKISFNALVELFNANSKPTRPEVLKRDQTESGCLVQLRVPTNLAYIDGHFPQIAVVPGVCQLKWVIEEIETFCQKKRAITSMEAVKFHELLIPGQEFCLEFACKAGTDKWIYRLFCGERKVSSGRLQFAP